MLNACFNPIHISVKIQNNLKSVRKAQTIPLNEEFDASIVTNIFFKSIYPKKKTSTETIMNRAKKSADHKLNPRHSSHGGLYSLKKNNEFS